MLIEGIEIKEEDLCILSTTSLSGFKFINEPGIKLKHLPTGLEAKSTSERSQHSNKAKALQELALLLKERQATPTKINFQENDEVWVASKEGSNKYKATVIATGEHFTCVHIGIDVPGMEKKEIVENERVFALDYKEVKKHPHAELMLEYAKDAKETDKPWERWEFTNHAVWHPCTEDISWQSECYRRKPKTIKIGNYDVPEPLKEIPEDAEFYFVTLSTLIEPNVQLSKEQMQHLIDLRICHKTEEAAILHEKALLSFTRTELQE